MGNFRIRVDRRNVAVQQKEMYLTEPVWYSRIGTEELAQHIHDDTGIAEAMCLGALKSILKQSVELILNGHPIRVEGLGIFKIGVRARAADSVEDSGSRSVYRRSVLFLPSKNLKSECKKVGFETIYSERVGS